MDPPGARRGGGRVFVGGKRQRRALDAESRFVHREVIGLLVLSVVVVVGVFLTRAAAEANRTLRSRDAAAWYQLARRQEREGRAAAAVRALRRATALDRQRREYRIALGTALAANGEDAAARQVLLDIRDSAPDDADVNVQLAHLDARGGHVDRAVRYYQSALQELWRENQQMTRRALRVELIRFLVAHGRPNRALAEAITLSSNTPDHAAAQNEAGWLLLETGDPGRALAMFRRVLGRHRTDAAALEGAGAAAFDTGDYAAALRYLRAAGPSLSSHRVELRTIAGLVMSRDPFRAGLRLDERRRRLIVDLETARERLENCLKKTSDEVMHERLERLRQVTAVSPATLRLKQLWQFPEALDATYRGIYQIEQDTAGCGAQTPADRALLIIGRRHAVTE
jgi:tetratricopeptide (TPR) repeat protein